MQQACKADTSGPRCFPYLMQTPWPGSTSSEAGPHVRGELIRPTLLVREIWYRAGRTMRTAFRQHVLLRGQRCANEPYPGGTDSPPASILTR
jgi:hypothetical protein